MKILLVAFQYHPSIGGAQEHVRLLAEELASRGHEVSVYTTKSLTNTDMFRFDFSFPFFHRGQKNTLKNFEKLNKVKVYRYPISIRFFSFSKIPELYAALKRSAKDFDIINAFGFNLLSSVKACRSAKKAGKPFVLNGIDVAIPPSTPKPAKLLKKLYDKTYGKYLIKNSKKIFSLTQDQIPEYLSRGAREEQTDFLNPGLVLPKYSKDRKDILPRLGVKKGEKAILFAGRLVLHKGVQDLISLLPALGAKLIIAGADGGHQKTLESLAASLGVSGKAIFTGPLPEEDLLSLYKHCDVLALPSKMEGFGIVLAEAMACGTPCVAYDIPSVRDIIQDNQNGFLAKDIQDLGQKIQTLLKDKKTYSRIRAAGLKSSKQYSIKSITDKLEEAYKCSLQQA